MKLVDGAKHHILAAIPSVQVDIKVKTFLDLFETDLFGRAHEPVTRKFNLYILNRRFRDDNNHYDDGDELGVTGGWEVEHESRDLQDLCLPIQQ